MQTRRLACITTIGSLAVSSVVPSIYAETSVVELDHLHHEAASFIEEHTNEEHTNVFEGTWSVTGSITGPMAHFKAPPARALLFTISAKANKITPRAMRRPQTRLAWQQRALTNYRFAPSCRRIYCEG